MVDETGRDVCDDSDSSRRQENVRAHLHERKMALEKRKHRRIAYGEATEILQNNIKANKMNEITKGQSVLEVAKKKM